MHLTVIKTETGSDNLSFYFIFSVLLCDGKIKIYQNTLRPVSMYCACD